MKVKIKIIVFIFSIIQFDCSTLKKPQSVSKDIEQQTDEYCSDNVDSYYRRDSVLLILSDQLNSSIPEFKKAYDPMGFYFKNDRPVNFFVHDLTDTLNSSNAPDKCVDFVNYHVYHFSPLRFRFSFSHIAILQNGSIKIFKSINCADKGDNLEDVLSYLTDGVRKQKIGDSTISRVNNYRKYGIYFKTDPQSTIQCKVTK